MSPRDDGTLGPTAELLLDTRTPAEIAIAPEGVRLAFALHATVADTGSHVPSALYLMEGDGPPTQLTSGASSRELRIGARRSVRPRSSSARSRSRAPTSSWSCIRAKVTSRWNGHTR
jgi:hypothetical protein